MTTDPDNDKAIQEIMDMFQSTLHVYPIKDNKECSTQRVVDHFQSDPTLRAVNPWTPKSHLRHFFAIFRTKEAALNASIRFNAPQTFLVSLIDQAKRVPFTTALKAQVYKLRKADLALGLEVMENATWAYINHRDSGSPSAKSGTANRNAVAGPSSKRHAPKASGIDVDVTMEDREEGEVTPSPAPPPSPLPLNPSSVALSAPITLTINEVSRLIEPLQQKVASLQRSNAWYTTDNSEQRKKVEALETQLAQNQRRGTAEVDTLKNDRASLNKEVEELKRQLETERSMRLKLEEEKKVWISEKTIAPEMVKAYDALRAIVSETLHKRPLSATPNNVPKPS